MNNLFSKYKIENIQDNFRVSLLKVGNKVMITSMVDQIINEKLDDYLSAVNFPNLKPVRNTLNLEVDGDAEYIELPEAVYMPIIQND